MGAGNFYTFGLQSHKVWKPFNDTNLSPERLDDYKWELRRRGFKVNDYVKKDYIIALDLLVWKMVRKLMTDTLTKQGWRAEYSDKEPFGWYSSEHSLFSYTAYQVFTKSWTVDAKDCSFSGSALLYFTTAYHEGFALNLAVEAEDHTLTDGITADEVNYQRRELYGAAMDAVVRSLNAQWKKQVDTAEGEFLSLENITKLSFADLWDAYDKSMVSDGKEG